MERDDILALIQNDPEAIVTIIQRLEEEVKQLQELCSLQQARIAELERRTQTRTVKTAVAPHPPMASNDLRKSVKRPGNVRVVRKDMKVGRLNGVRLQTSSRHTAQMSVKNVVHPLLSSRHPLFRRDRFMTFPPSR